MCLSRREVKLGISESYPKQILQCLVAVKLKKIVRDTPV